MSKNWKPVTSNDVVKKSYWKTGRSAVDQSTIWKFVLDG